MGARSRLLRSILLAAPVFLASVLGACGGGLSTPDLSTGEISGRLVNVQDPAQAHVYVVGHPETLAKEPLMVA